MTNIPDKELKFSVYKEVTQIDQKAENLSEKWAPPPQKKITEETHVKDVYLKTFRLATNQALFIER